MLLGGECRSFALHRFCTEERRLRTPIRCNQIERKNVNIIRRKLSVFMCVCLCVCGGVLVFDGGNIKCLAWDERGFTNDEKIKEMWIYLKSKEMAHVPCSSKVPLASLRAAAVWVREAASVRVPSRWCAAVLGECLPITFQEWREGGRPQGFHQFVKNEFNTHTHNMMEDWNGNNFQWR